MQDVEGKVAFITGGSSGIGRGIALAFGRAGMQVVISGRKQEHIDESLAEFAAAGLDISAVRLDVTDADAVEAAAEETVRRFGRVDVLVNNAGIGLTGPVMGATASDWDWLIDVNIKGVGNGLRAFVPRIQGGGQGTSSPRRRWPV
jgi:NAD(P)-dependent dehydrogenase (short-subunit alcohol dehydrogenase family)